MLGQKKREDKGFTTVDGGESEEGDELSDRLRQKGGGADRLDHHVAPAALWLPL